MVQPRKRPRQQRARATWEAVLDAAAQLFEAAGYQAATTNAIAARAGVSIGSLYQYFPNKDAILLALAERHLGVAAAALQTAFIDLSRTRPDLAGTVTTLVRAAVDLHRHDPAMHRLLFDQAPRTPELVNRLRSLEGMLAGAVATELSRLGVGGRNPAARALLVVQAIEAQVHGAVIEPPAGSSTDDLVAEIENLWIGALRAEGRG
jgi:AcrR family transcriptional regulator